MEKITFYSQLVIKSKQILHSADIKINYYNSWPIVVQWLLANEYYATAWQLLEERGSDNRIQFLCISSFLFHLLKDN